MKKRIIALLLVVSLVGVLFAAGQAEASGPTAAKPLVLR